MGRLLFWLGMAFLALYLWRRWRRADSAAPPVPPPPQQVVPCAWCAVHVPQAEALGEPGGPYFCCADHQTRYRQRKDRG